MTDDKTAADCVEAWHAYRAGPRYQDSEDGRFNSRVPFEHGFDAGAAWQAERFSREQIEAALEPHVLSTGRAAQLAQIIVTACGNAGQADG